jgi:riboflavin synthase
MFTGIVEEVGTVSDIAGRLVIQAKKVVEGMNIGDSIAVNGVCLTVVSFDGGSFCVELMPETLRRTNLGKLRRGDKVNLERAMPVNGRFGGHFVQGHVDDMGMITSVWREQQAVGMKFSVPKHLMVYIVDKGFVAVDGVSLTVINPESAGFSVSLVGYTLTHTTLAHRRPGDMVNIEVDILAKYLERVIETRGHGVTLELLEKYGFAKAR